MSELASDLGLLRARQCQARSVALPSGLTPAQVLARIGDRRGLVCLDGAWAGGGAILAWDPEFVLPAGADPWSALGTLPQLVSDSGEPVSASDRDVIGGGWFGVLGWASSANRLGFYDHLLRWSAEAGWRLESLYCLERAAALVRAEHHARELLAGPEPPPGGWTVGPVQTRARHEHLAAVENAIGAIRDGAIYQVNVCTELSASFHGDPTALFAAAVTRLRPDYGALVTGLTVASEERAPELDAVVSLSPELFLRRHAGQLESRPIKGTVARTPDVEGVLSGENQGIDPAVRRLRHSTKDAAENVMIVDLMRNDLTRVADAGSVRARDLLQIQPHAGVWHLVSTVVAEVGADVSDARIVQACFPPGSVSGAPKLRATALIEELEATPRGAYTGALGFISPAWGAEFSVLIRTFEITGDRLRLGVGGGVTADSVPMLEWQECLDKATPVLAAVGASIDASSSATRRRESDPDQAAGGILETMLVVDGVVAHLDAHLARLVRSGRELFDADAAATLRAEVERVASVQAPGRAVLRIISNFGGHSGDSGDGGPNRLRHEVTAAPLGPPPGRSAGCPTRRLGGWWRHKWADRHELAEYEAWAIDQARGVPPLPSSRHSSLNPVPLFVDDSGRFALETSRGNVFRLIPGPGPAVLSTPPLDDDVLPGVTRRLALDAARDLGFVVRIEPLRLAELGHGAVFWTSALSGLVEFGEIDGRPIPAGGVALRQLRARLGIDLS